MHRILPVLHMHRILPVLLALASAAHAEDLVRAVGGYLSALEDGAETELDTVVVTASRTPTPQLDAPVATNAVPADVIDRRAYRTVPQILRDVEGVMVQETAAGQGSPFIRGFTGFLTLFLIDGIRLNSSVFRPGPNQYWSTIDAWSIDRLEVVKGPSSVLYGSDAVGGTVQAITKSPYAFGDGLATGGRFLYRGSTAEHSHTGRIELSLGLREETGALLGLTGKHFGDLEAGGDVGTQTGVGYDEWDGDVKVEHYLDDDTRLVLAYQHVQQNNVPRTHRTVFAKSFHGTTVGSELQRDLDQERWLVYAQLHAENLEGFLDALHASLSWHSQSEVRDRIRPPSSPGDPNRRDKQGFDVGTLGFWIQLESGGFTYGLEVYHDEVDSFSTRNPVQGPVADDATYDLLAAYVQRVLDVTERLRLTAGARVTYAAADADRVSDPDTGAAVSLSDDWTAIVGSLRALYRLVEDRWNLFGGVSQGFRAPNLSDLTRFDGARSNEFEIPAPGLDPEHYVSFELGVKGRSDRFAVQLALFYTLIRDQIIRFPTGDTNADGDVLVTKANVGDGWVYGVELGGSYRVAAGWTVFGNLTYLEGRVDTFPTSAQVVAREPLSRLMPLTGQVGVRWEEPAGRFWAELQVLMAGRADELSTRDMGDTQRIPPGGTPGYGVVHLRGGWRIDEKTSLTLAVENLFDKAYRVHGSGITMPGINVIAVLVRDF